MLHLGMMVIPKSTSEKRIKENLAACDISLTPDEMKRLEAIDRNRRLFLLDFLQPKGVSQKEAWDVAADEAFTQ